MTKPTFLSTRDANEPGLILAAMRAGASVLPLNFPDRLGVPDLIVGHNRRMVCPHCAKPFHYPTNTFVEVKTAKGRIRGSQRDCIGAWHGSVYIARDCPEILAALGIDTQEPDPMDSGPARGR